jgi:long-chain acyl-CoA synthetase
VTHPSSLVQGTDAPSIGAVVARMRANGPAPAMFWGGREYSYDELFAMTAAWERRLAAEGVGPGTVCGILSDYTPQTSSLIVALLETGAVIVPFTVDVVAELPSLLAVAGVERLFRFEADDRWTTEAFAPAPRLALMTAFLTRRRPGLVVFTSGSTGKPKGILHDAELVMRKFMTVRPGWRTVLFLLMDHFGGFNTLLSCFAYSGVGVCLPRRTPDAVCQAIEAARADLLPTTPTFLNVLIASGAYRKYDLSSIRLITYGTELMPDATLRKVVEIFPHAQLKQTYGLSELGVLRSDSESRDSVWVRIGGAGFEVKVKDSLLWVRSESNMVGYLNAPSPFDDEGWMCTGDQVEVRGDYVRFLGRKTEVINVGGKKVYPVEVETVLLEAENVRSATVFAGANPLLGQVVHARISLDEPEDGVRLAERLRTFCYARLAKYKVPVRFTVVAEGEQHSARFKKLRPGTLLDSPLC